MNPDKKKMWIDALLSGEYKQGRGALKYKNGYCCYGVLCDVAIKDGLKVEVKTDTWGTTFYDDNTVTVPYSVMEWAGMDSGNPETDLTRREVTGEYVYSPTQPATFASLNDNGYTFEEIVPVIERVL